MNTFTINQKEYKAKPFDFNLICDLEDMGVSMQQADEKPMALVRAYFGLCANKGKKYAGEEMQKHIIGGGTFDDVMKAMSDEMDKSDFFHSLNKNADKTEAETEATESPEE